MIIETTSISSAGSRPMLNVGMLKGGFVIIATLGRRFGDHSGSPVSYMDAAARPPVAVFGHTRVQIIKTFYRKCELDNCISDSNRYVINNTL